MTTRTLRHGLLVLLLAVIAASAVAQTAPYDGVDPTLKEIEETQTELERAKRILADRDERVALEQTLRYLDGEIRRLRSDQDREARARSEVLDARERLSQAQSELDAHYSGIGGFLRWLGESRVPSRGHVYLLNLAIRDAARDLDAAEARHAEALRDLEARARPLRAEFGTADPSELTRRRDELQTRIRDATIMADRLEELRRDESLLSERLDRLHGEHRDRASTPAPPPPPVTEADVGASQGRIELLERDIEFYEAVLQNTRVIFVHSTILGGVYPVERGALRDRLIFEMRDGRITPEEAIKEAQRAVALDAYVRSLLSRRLDSLRARRDEEQAQHDALVTRLRQEAGSGVTHELWVGTTLTSGMEIAARPPAYGGTVSYWHRGIPDGTTITLTAPATHPGTPAPWDNTFIEWTGCDSASGTSCTVTMTGNRSVSVDYAPGCYAWGRMVWDDFCMGHIEDGRHDEIKTAQNRMPGFAGSATYRCDRGTWVRLSATCTRTD